MASRTPSRPPASPAGSATIEALDALLEALSPLSGPIAVAYTDPDLPAPVIRAPGDGALPGVAPALLDMGAPGDPPEGLSSIASPDGAPWVRAAFSAGDEARLVLAVRGPLEVVDALLVETAALRAVRALVLDRERRAAGRLRQLLATSRRAVASLDLDEVLAAIVRDATELLHGRSGDMLLLDDDRRVLRVAAVWNFPPDMLGFELVFGRGVSSQAMASGHPIQVPDYRTYEHRAPELDRYDFGAVLCAPLVFRGEAIGALNVHSGQRGARYTTSDVELLAAFAGHAAIAIDHARRYANEVRLGRDLADANRDLTRSLAVQQRLAEQVILDGGAAGIAGVLARDLGRRVVIEDHLHRTIAAASPEGETDRNAPGSEPFSVAVRVGREVVGHLLLSDEGELGPIDRALVDVAVTGVALELAKQRAALEVEERLRGEAFGDLLAGSFPSPGAIAARAARLGYDLDEPRDVIVIAVDAPDHEDAAAVGGRSGPARDGVGPGQPSARRLAAVRERLAVRHPGSLAIVHAGSVVVLATRDRVGTDDAAALGEELRAAVVAAGAPAPVTAGVGARCGRPEEYAPAFREAREAIELMRRLGRAGTTISAAELGPYALLLRATSRDDLEAFARRTLGRLLVPGATHGADHLRTLRIHLEEDRIQRRTAARCFIHVNTVVYRIRRIEELLGRSLDDPETVFDLTLALRIVDLLALAPDATAPDGPRRRG